MILARTRLQLLPRSPTLIFSSNTTNTLSTAKDIARMAPAATMTKSATMSSSAAHASPSAPPKAPTHVEPFVLPSIGGVDKDGISVAEARENIKRDLRSDTATIPTPEMATAMAEASVGDNVMNEDLTTASFEASVASLCGKEAGLYVPSGTLSNQLCLRTWLLQPPYAVICDHRAHIHRHEAGGVAYHSGAAVELIQPSNGAYLRWVDIEPQIALDDGDVHAAPTKIVSLENTLQGTILPQDEILTIRKGLDELRAQGHDIKLHLDGARLWNVSAATGKSMKELCEPFDSVSLCFSKGLGAPIGSMMLGPQALIRKAHHFRKLFGAGMRQSGFIAAAARVALTSHFNKLAYTHELARWTANALEQLGVRITMPVDTNMVFIDTTPLGFDARTLVERAQAERGIKLGGARLVVHHQIVPETMSDLVQIVAQLKAENEGVKLESKGKSDGYPSMATRK